MNRELTNAGEQRLKWNHYRFLAVVAAILAILCSGCGSSSSPSSTAGPLDAAQAQAVSQQVVQALTTALGDALGVTLPSGRPAHPSMATVVADSHPYASSGCTTTSTGESCNLPLSYSGSCSAGGTISVSGDISGTLDSTDSGNIGAQITVTPSNCAVSGTTFNGDPDITINGQIGFSDANIVYPVTLTEGGGISYGPDPSGTCSLNVTYSISSSLTCTVTGTICGQSVNGSC